MTDRDRLKIYLSGVSLGLCLMSGTVRQAYPDIGFLQPLLAYAGGFTMASAVFLRRDSMAPEPRL